MSNPIGSPKGGKKNLLTYDAFFQLCQWLLNKQEMLIKDAPLMQELEKLASKDLQCTITEANLRSAIETAKVQYNPKRALPAKPGSGVLYQKVTMLETELQQVKAHGAILTGIVTALAKELNFPIPGMPTNPQNIQVVNHTKK